MNRATIIYIALAVLLAHTLAIHKTPAGDFSPPYEDANVAFRQGRNMVFQGTGSWAPGEQAEDSYPSLPWIGLAAVAERTYIGPNRVAQVVGVLSALLTIGVLAGFTMSRLAGLIATGLFAASGTVAAAAGSGMEATTVMLAGAVVVLAFERGWRVLLALSSCALVWMAPEGIAILGVVLIFDTFKRPGGKERRSLRNPMLIGVLAWGLLLFYRWQTFGSPFSAYWRNLASWNPERLDLGVAYVKSFLVASGSAPLLAIPILMAMVGRLEARGVRALVLFAAWATLAAFSGGDARPYWLALVPAIPMFALAVQVAVRSMMDDEPRLAPVAWLILSVGVLASLLVSKVPGNLGPLQLGDVQDAWMTPGERLAKDYPAQLGRRGLLLHAKHTERLRCLGVFLRDRTLKSTTIHTLWPGSIGYLSRRRVVDLLGRAWPAGDSEQTQSWSGSPKADLVAAMMSEPDYLVLFIDGFAEGAKPVEYLRATLDRYDTVGATPARMVQVLDVLQRYELVCVPVPHNSKNLRVPSPHPFPLLRARRLGMTPELMWKREGNRATLLARHHGHDLVVDLRVQQFDENGTPKYLSPSGRTTKRLRHARTDLLLFESGDRPIELFSMLVPPGTGRLAASLLNPGSGSDTTLVELGTEAVLQL